MYPITNTPAAGRGTGTTAETPPGAPGGMVLPGGTRDNPLAMGRPGLPPTVTLPLTPLRLAAAMFLDQAHRTTAPVTVVSEVDMTNLKTLHDWTKPLFTQSTGTPLTYTPFFAWATVQALQAYPLLNSTLADRYYVIPRYINLGVATHIPGSVVIVVLHNAEQKSVTELAQELHLKVQRARSGQLNPADLAGPTFVITNPGVWGQTLFGTPTIAPGNVGTMSFETIQKRPVVLADDRIAVRPMMHICLSADHRAVDGADMMGFIGSVKQSLETLGV